MGPEPPDLITTGSEHGPTFVFAHGAGAPMTSTFMQDMTERLGDRGLQVVRFNFPYMAERERKGTKRPPNSKTILLDTWRSVIAELGNPQNIFIGGKSMGGRMASMIADDHNVQGLICLGYPFHPPGKPEKPRVAHLESLKTPTLICQGIRDTLGNIDTVNGYKISGAIELYWLPDGDHSLKPRVKSGYTLDQNLDTTADKIQSFVMQHLSKPSPTK